MVQFFAHAPVFLLFCIKRVCGGTHRTQKIDNRASQACPHSGVGQPCKRGLHAYTVHMYMLALRGERERIYTINEATNMLWLGMEYVVVGKRVHSSQGFSKWTARLAFDPVPRSRSCTALLRHTATLMWEEQESSQRLDGLLCVNDTPC